MVTISVIVDKEPRRYRGISEVLMQGFIIVYFDIRPLLKSQESIRDLLYEIILTAEFVCEDLPEKYAKEVIKYLEKNNTSVTRLEDKLIYILDNGSDFLNTFEQILSNALKNEYLELLRKTKDKI